MGVHFHCGNVSTGKNKFTFLGGVPEGRIVCARCEEAAIAGGLPSSTYLSGHHVCIGGVKAYSICCGEAKKNPAGMRDEVDSEKVTGE